MKRISQFEKPETFCMPFSKKSMPDTIRVAVLNAEHGYNWYFDSQRRIGTRVALFCELDVAGYEYRFMNETGVPTRRRPTGNGILKLRLDWLFGRGVTCMQYGSVSTVVSDSALRELSDHDIIWADIRI